MSSVKMRKNRPDLVIWVVILAVSAISLSLTGCSGDQKNKVRRVILISIDTCRADYLGCYGYERNTSPNMDALAAEATVFTHAISPIPLTLPAHGSMLTGTIPPVHGLHDNLNSRLSESNTTIAEVLKQNGLATAAIISTYVLDSQFGMSQGFDNYNDEFEEPVMGHEDMFERSGAEASRLACEWLDENHQENFFFFLHYYDPHTTYAPPEPFASEYADNLYAGEIAHTDNCISKVIDKLKALGIYESSLIIIVGDHGEGLGEHGEEEHGYFIYDGFIRVPFIVKSPMQRKPKRIDRPVSLVDVVPTICGYLGITPPEGIQGVDLSKLPDKTDDADKPRYIYCESLYPTLYKCNPLLGVVEGRWKYIETTRPELYDLSKNPGETKNLIQIEPHRARILSENLRLILTQHNKPGQAGDEFAMDDQARRRLESLGYIGDSDVDQSLEMNPNKEDPKDLIQYHEYTFRVIRHNYQREYDKAVGLCNKMIELRPDLPHGELWLTRIAFSQEQYENVIEHGQKYLDLVDLADQRDPDGLVLGSSHGTGMIHSLLASAFFNKEDYPNAIKHYRKVLETTPNRADILCNLGSALYKTDQIEEALVNWKKSLQLNPRQPEIRDNLAAVLSSLGKIAHKEGQLEKAVQNWNESLLFNDNQTDVHIQLGQIFSEMDEPAKAIRHWTAALRLQPDNLEIKERIELYKTGRKDKELENNNNSGDINK